MPRWVVIDSNCLLISLSCRPECESCSDAQVDVTSLRARWSEPTGIGAVFALLVLGRAISNIRSYSFVMVLARETVS